MADALKIALDKRAKLHEEVAKLNDFIRFGEGLIREAENSEDESAEAADKSTDKKAEAGGSKPVEVSRPTVLRRRA